MTRRVSPIPEGFSTIVPHLVVNDAAAALAFYGRALGVREISRSVAPHDGRIMHSEILLGDARIFVVDEVPEQGERSPVALGGSAVVLHVYVRDVDATYERAVREGMEVQIPVADFFWGERYALLRDPFGHRWALASRTEDISPDELQDRVTKLFSSRRT